MASLHYIAVALLFACLTGSATGDTEHQLPGYTDHICIRECTEKEEPRICKYDWVIENYYVLSKACFDCPFNQSQCYLPHCVSADGVSRAILTANRKLPGPTIQVCKGDTIEVTVHNEMGNSEGTSIHWHGILQRGSQHMDGVSQVTQCPIAAHTKFTYRFKADDPGTHFWHEHSGVQRADGLFGSLIVRRPPSLEPHNHLYDFDLPEHVMIVNDWFNISTIHKFVAHHHSNGDNKPRQMLINGVGSYEEFTDAANRSYFTPRAAFTVQPGKKYRFRVINAGVSNCPIQISVDDHKLLMIASDGNSFKPFLVDSFNTFAGERYDFILHANKGVCTRNYWIRFRGLADCNVKFATQTAILKYQGAPDVLPPETTSWEDGDRTGVLLNLWNFKGNDTHVDISRMRSEDQDDSTLTSKPDKIIYLSMDFYKINNPSFNHPEYYPLNSVVRNRQLYTPQINRISNSLPPFPLLSQFDEVPETSFCNSETIKEPCEQVHCSCIHRYQITLGDLVELILIDEGVTFNASHPMHLHGYKFRVVALDKIGKSTSVEEVKAMDAKGEIKRITTGAPLKDTVIVPDGGYTIIRFRADNPGIWFFHCHIEFHAEIGMGLLFQVGTREQLPENPKNFPTCGDWKMAE